MVEASGNNLILLVEDDYQVIKLFTVYLQQGGYDVAVASDGEGALEAALVLSPAAILLDLLLPDMDGWEVLARLKSSSYTRQIPVLIVSVLDRQTLGFELGAVEHLVKPVDRGQLLLALERTLLRGRYADRAPRVLVIHGDADELQLLTLVLEQEGYEVFPAQSGVEGMGLARSVPPDLAVMDLPLSDLDSFQMIARLRRERATHALPVLVITDRALSAEQKERLDENSRAIVIGNELSQHVLLQTVGHLLLEARR